MNAAKKVTDNPFSRGLRNQFKILRRLRPKVKLLKDFYVFDTETGEVEKDGWIQWKLSARPESFRFGVIYGYNYERTIYSREEFHQVLLEERFKNKYVFAHYLEYDLDTLYGSVYNVDKKALYRGSTLIKATNGNCYFVDSMNIFVGQGVESIGLSLGIKKPDLGDKNMRSFGIGPNELNRCSTDCRIVWDALFRSFEFAGDIKITQASLSMTYYRRYHQPYDIHHNQNVKYFWDSYYGGRCEAFKIGKTHASMIDINSTYPDAMKKCIFPNPKFLRVEENVDTKYFINNILPHFEGCVYADVLHKEHWLGHLPVKMDGKLMFPIGNISGCWNFNEFRYVLETGVIDIKSIKRIVYSEPMVSPFITYIDTLFELKYKAELAGDDFWRDLYKRYANSLYGKFAQRIEEETQYIEDIQKQWDIIEQYRRDGKFIRLDMFNQDRLDAYLVTKSSQSFNISYSIPSFASYITSYSRVQLLDKLRKMENNVPVYCDTDSIAFEIDDGTIESSKALGEWKLEKKVITEICGLKNYKFEFVNNKGELIKKHRLKGVPEKNRHNALDSQGKEIANEYEYFNLIKTKEALRRNMKPGKLIRRTKTISGKYTKRIVFSDGTTKPITV